MPAALEENDTVLPLLGDSDSDRGKRRSTLLTVCPFILGMCIFYSLYGFPVCHYQDLEVYTHLPFKVTPTLLLLFMYADRFMAAASGNEFCERLAYYG